ncbi:MAG: hypothetical protein K6G57_06840, partial [Lachnospiraceae bacterium]|nr:hypothetical protein [Lachnospiraceae bacterium]
MNLSKIKIILFVTVLILPTILWIALGVAAPSLRSELDYDLGEKRDKTEVSSIAELSGSGTVLSDYFADRAPFRSLLITTYQKAETALESAYEKGIKPAAMAMIYGSGTTDVKTASGDAYEQLFAESETPVDETVSGDGTSAGSAPEVAEPAKHIHDYVITATVEADYDTYGYTEYICSECGETRTKWQDKLVDNSYLAPDVRNSVTIIGRREWLFLYGYGNIPYYQATNLLTEEEMAEYAQKLQTLKDLCDDRGITLAVLFVPNKDQVYSEYMPSFQVEDEYKRVARLTDYLNE